MKSTLANGVNVSLSVKQVYLDVCALCRPFDDQTRMRIRLEAEAVQLILSHVRTADLILVVSPVHDVEIAAIPDATEREYLVHLLRQVGQRISANLDEVRARAELLATQGLGPADAAHLAFAESASADFVTCDDRLLRQCRRLAVHCWYGTPLALCEKENLR